MRTNAAGQFDNLDEVVATCREVVDASLRHLCKPGLSERNLFEADGTFGDDPGVKGGPFSSWTYARDRCPEICAAAQA